MKIINRGCPLTCVTPPSWPCRTYKSSILSSLCIAVVWLYDPVASIPVWLGEKAIEDMIPEHMDKKKEDYPICKFLHLYRNDNRTIVDKQISRQKSKNIVFKWLNIRLPTWLTFLVSLDCWTLFKISTRAMDIKYPDGFIVASKYPELKTSFSVFYF